MRILAIDAATKVLSIAVIEDDNVLATSALNVGKTHSERLLPIIEQTLKLASIELKTMDAIAVTIGPGSFTGLRIGISTAKGLAKTLGVNLIPVTTLEALAYNGRYMDKLICPVLDARKDEVYTALYDEKGNVLMEETAMHPKLLAETIKEQYPNKKVVFLGDAADIFIDTFKEILNQEILNQEVLDENAILMPAGNRLFASLGTAYVALENPERGTLPELVKADYIRMSEAEVQMNKKLAAQNDK